MKQVTVGDIVEVNGVLYKIADVVYVTPGRRMAVAHATLYSVVGKHKLEMRLKDDMEKIDLTEQECTFVSKSSGNIYMFMDLESHTMIDIPGQKIDKPELLTDGMIVKVYSTEAHGISHVEIPQNITATVISAGLEGESGKNKPVAVDIYTEKYPAGLIIQAPSYIKRGDQITFSKDLEFKSRVQQK